MLLCSSIPAYVPCPLQHVIPTKKVIFPCFVSPTCLMLAAGGSLPVRSSLHDQQRSTKTSRTPLPATRYPWSRQRATTTSTSSSTFVASSCPKTAPAKARDPSGGQLFVLSKKGSGEGERTGFGAHEKPAICCYIGGWEGEAYTYVVRLENLTPKGARVSQVSQSRAG